MKPVRTRCIVGSIATFIFCAVTQTGCDGDPQCAKDIQAGTTYHVTLKAKSLSDDYWYPGGFSGSPSCAGIDKLVDGSLLDIALPANPSHADVIPTRCWTAQGNVTSDVGLTLAESDVVLLSIGQYGPLPMLFVSGQFSTGGCVGTWNLTAVDGPTPPNSSVPHRWARRVIQLDSTAACQAAYQPVASAAQSLCEDEWDIDIQAM